MPLISIPHEPPENVYLSLNDLIERGFNRAQINKHFPTPDKVHNDKPFYQLKKILELNQNTMMELTPWQLNEARLLFNVPDAADQEVAVLLLGAESKERVWIEETTEKGRSMTLSDFDQRLLEILHPEPEYENTIHHLPVETN